MEKKKAENSAVVLAMFSECMSYLTHEDLDTGIPKVEKALREFFDADCMALIRWENGISRSMEESHKESAESAAKILTDMVENNKELVFQGLLEKEENLFLPNIQELKEEYPKYYEQLVSCQIESLAGWEMKDGICSVGVLFAVNPRIHTEDCRVIQLLAESIAPRIMYQNLQEIREYEITHDHLTNLWNRQSFVLWKDRSREDIFHSLGIVTADIVGLSGFNREFGYLNGSKRLVELARLLDTVFEGFRIFRYEDDEMLVFCPNVDKADFMFMVKCLQEKTEEQDFAVAVGYSWSCHVNVDEQITEAEVVMSNDKFRYMRGGNLPERIEQSVIDEVTQLIHNGMYKVYLQPKVKVQDGRTVGAEALVRQIDPVLGLVSPAKFIPVLERYNVIHMVDLFVLEKVFAYQKDALEAGRNVVPISVNFSKCTILRPNLIESIREMSNKYSLPEDLIIIEVTETVGDMDHVVVNNVADNLKTMGFALSMDDFGTHYSNLATLIQYDFDSAKIDRSMITEITSNHKSRVVLDYMTSLINELGIKCIVEGIETKEQVDILRETKCDMIQGFYFGKPVPMEEFYGKYMKTEQ